MPRFFFHIVHPDSPPVPDDEGLVFDNMDEARAEALASLRDLIGDTSHGRVPAPGLAIQIVDEDNHVLETFRADTLTR